MLVWYGPALDSDKKFFISNTLYPILRLMTAAPLSFTMAQHMALELEGGSMCRGLSFGAHKPAAGELVFQTGMVGYPESITDPSYRGQILVITFPLVGNYGVPDRAKVDTQLPDIPAYFESRQIHIAALVVASYCGEEYSHHLATSSLGSWLKEQGVPAIYGVDTRRLTQMIREEGSMLGRLLLPNPHPNGLVDSLNGEESNSFKHEFQEIEWLNPNLKNLVAEGV
jgi:carbamoyl-phosphate synthase / aspartate carbamoyltransferase